MITTLIIDDEADGRDALKSGTVRASFAMYNTESEIDRFVVCLRKVINLLKQ